MIDEIKLIRINPNQGLYDHVTGEKIEVTKMTLEDFNKIYRTEKGKKK